MISPKKTKLWHSHWHRLSARDLRGQISCWRCSWTGAHIALPGYCLLWPYACWLFCSWRAGRKVLVAKIGRVDRHMKDCQRLQSLALLGCWQMFLVWQSTVEFVFTWKLALKEMAPTKEKLFFRIFVLFCVGFLKVEYLLEAYVLECVWMVMVQLRRLYQGRGWHVRSTWSLN